MLYGDGDEMGRAAHVLSVFKCGHSCSIYCLFAIPLP